MLRHNSGVRGLSAVGVFLVAVGPAGRFVGVAAPALCDVGRARVPLLGADHGARAQTSPSLGWPYGLAKHRSRPWVWYPVVVATTALPIRRDVVVSMVNMLTTTSPKQGSSGKLRPSGGIGTVHVHRGLPRSMES